MKIRTSVLLLVTLFSISALSAQDVGKRVERRVKQRAESKVNREVDKTVDQAIDNVFDGLFGKKKKKNKKEEADTVPEEAAGHEDREVYDEAEAQRRQQEMIARMMGGADQEEWEPVKNDFPVSFHMYITSEEKGKTSVANINYTFDTWLLGMQMQSDEQEGDMLLILDNEKGTMTTVMEKDGKRQGYRMNRGMISRDAVDDAMKDVKITATGNSKKIDGYLCQEYLVEGEDHTTNAWMTKDLNVDMSQIFSGFSGLAGGKSRNPSPEMLQYQAYGLMLEGTTVSKNGKETTYMRISDVKLGDAIDRSILDVSDVEIMGIGN